MFANIELNDIENFPKALDNLLNKQRQNIQNLIDNSSDEFDTILKPMQEMDEELGLFFTPLSHLNSVLNSKETQKAYEESLPLLSKFGTEISQNKELYLKIKSLKAYDEESTKVIQNHLQDFHLSGVDLDEESKKRLEEISMRLSQLSNEFSQNLLDATNEYELIVTDFEDVKELPQSDLEAAKEEIEGKIVYKFTLQMPSYIAYMTYGSNRELRAKLSKAYSTRAPQNEQVIDEILSLRDEKAKILGFENYAQLSLEKKDAPDTKAVLDFLNQLLDAALPHAKKELEELKAFAKETDGIEDLQGYDVAYYSEKLKKRKFDFDESMTKPYFEQSKVLDGLLDIVSKLFDLRFESVKSPIWHECVKVYDVYEQDKLSSRIYFDLEARSTKRGGAWMNDYETHFVDTQNKTHLPSAFVVCNFAPSTTNSPSLLRHDDVVTLFHEMGHALHHILGKCSQRDISGINGVAWDVVEFPSQFLENFAYEKAILKQFAFHHKSGESMSDELLDKIKDSKNFQAALAILRQVEFSLFDFMLHLKLYQGKEVQELLDSIREKTALIKPPSYNRFQHGFAHIFAGGYAAGYYSYKWAEVLSSDAFFACLDDSGFNRQKAIGYKQHILYSGGKKPMSQLYIEWLSQSPKVQSLLKLYDID